MRTCRVPERVNRLIRAARGIYAWWYQWSPLLRHCCTYSCEFPLAISLSRILATSRCDYDGECDPDTEEPIDDLCNRVSRARRCAFNVSNCRRRVRPEEGCCALCGKCRIIVVVFLCTKIIAILVYAEHLIISPSF